MNATRFWRRGGTRLAAPGTDCICGAFARACAVQVSKRDFSPSAAARFRRLHTGRCAPARAGTRLASSQLSS